MQIIESRSNKERKPIALVGGTLIHGTVTEPLKNSVVLINGGTIAEIGSANHVAIPEGAKVIDTTNMTVMPGLIDLHTHLCSIPNSNFLPDQLETPETYLAMWGVYHAQLTLKAGFTTVRDAFSYYRQTGIISLRKATEMGLVKGPRIFAAGYVGMTGSIVDMRLPPDFNRPYGYAADGPWELRKRTREILRDGFDWIKTFTSGGRRRNELEEAVWNLNHTPEELKAIIDEAHNFSAKVMIHATTREAISLAIEAGADTIEHGWPLDDELIDLMIKKGIVLVPTLSPASPRGFLREDAPPEYKKLSQARFEGRMKSFRRAYEAGVKIATGSDIYPPMSTHKHGENAFELTFMVQQGMKPIDAIVAATLRGAEVLGIDSTVGTLQQGKRADVLVVRGNPLEKMECIEENVCYVFKEGRLAVDNLH
jgi:imidazolonepropionase-like amidohydrolase